MAAIPVRLERLRERIAAAESQAGRPAGCVTLVAVGKTFPAPVIAAAHGAGQRAFGENYAQEAVAKIDALKVLVPGAPWIWHFIGPIQSNKTRLLASHFDWVQTVERLSVAQRLSGQRSQGAAPLQVLIQVNASGEASKSGVEPGQAIDLALAVAQLPRLAVRGLMAIPEVNPDPGAQRRVFAAMRRLHEDVRAALARMPGGGVRFDTLSMGMSADFEAAILEGSTMVRVGSAIFGERS
jgi:PLP dependent protein